ncbi:hypothetical protein NMY22_g16243 [Coprinellus aureogranulatus]|nr:hypothetical protein NMY22_g16243 [Coprinellus aureogranulatus]
MFVRLRRMLGESTARKRPPGPPSTQPVHPVVQRVFSNDRNAVVLTLANIMEGRPSLRALVATIVRLGLVNEKPRAGAVTSVRVLIQSVPSSTDPRPAQIPPPLSACATFASELAQFSEVDVAQAEKAIASFADTLRDLEAMLLESRDIREIESLVNDSPNLNLPLSQHLPLLSLTLLSIIRAPGFSITLFSLNPHQHPTHTQQGEGGGERGNGFLDGLLYAPLGVPQSTLRDPQGIPRASQSANRLRTLSQGTPRDSDALVALTRPGCLWASLGVREHPWENMVFPDAFFHYTGLNPATLGRVMDVPSLGNKPHWNDKILTLAYKNKFRMVWPSKLEPWPGQKGWDPNLWQTEFLNAVIKFYADGYIRIESWSEEERELSETDPAFGLTPIVVSPSKSKRTIMFQVKDVRAWFDSRKDRAVMQLAKTSDVPMKRARKGRQLSAEIDAIYQSGPSNRPEIRNAKECNQFFKGMGMPQYVDPSVDDDDGDGEQEEPGSSPPRPVKRRRVI